MNLLSYKISIYTFCIVNRNHFNFIQYLEKFLNVLSSPHYYSTSADSKLNNKIPKATSPE